MRRLAWVGLAVVLCLSCGQKELEEEGTEAPGKVEQGRPVAADAELAAALEAPVPTGLSNYELAKALLSPGGLKLHDVKLVLKPEKMGAASEFYPFLVESGKAKLLLFVFEYADNETAEKATAELPVKMASFGIVHKGMAMQREKLVLIAGLDEDEEPGNELERLRTIYLKLFSR